MINNIKNYFYVHCIINMSIRDEIEKDMREKEYKKVKKQQKLLPKELVGLGNKDKDDWYETWTADRDLLNFPHPFRCCLFGKPNSGKSNYIKNILIRSFPPFSRVVVIHCDAQNTKEYEILGKNIEMLSEVPPPDFWKDNHQKTLCIVDDLDYSGANKNQKKNLSRLFGYCSSHCNVSVALTQQDTFSVPAIVRRCASVFVLWSSHDIISMSAIATRSGLRASDLRNIFETVCDGFRDSLTIDLTENSPAKLRKNGYEKISKLEGEDSLKERMKSDNFLIKR